MAVKTQDLKYNVTGQTVYFDCPEGRPSSIVSMKLYAMGSGDDGTVEAALDTPAIEASPDTTFDDVAGVGQSNRKLCPLTATTGTALGRRFLATNAAGERDWVEVGEIDSGVSITAKEPLKNAYASGAKFVSTRITAAVLDAFIQSSNKITDNNDPNPGYRLRVEYVYGNATEVHHKGVDVARYPGGHTVTPADMESYRAAWSNLLPTHHREDGGLRLLDEAYDDHKWNLFHAGVADETIRNQAATDRAVKLLAWVNATEGGDDEDLARHAAVKYQSFLDGLFRITAKVAKATDTSGAGVTGTVVSLLEK